MKDNQSQQLPQVVVEYIDEVIKKMGWRRKVRQDVRQELADHFTDALDHLSTEEAKLAAANDFITQFGDAALLAKLMRRAKKRCRPWWLKFIIRSLQIFAVFILVVALYSVWFLSGRPIITTDYVAQFNEYGRVPERVDNAQNAAQCYYKAAESYVDLSDITDIKNFNIRKKRYSTVSKDDETVIREWIIKNDQAISLWVEGSFKPYLWQEYASDTGEVVCILLKYLSQWRDINRAILWKAYLDAEDGNLKSAFENLLVSYRTASHIKSQKTIIEQLVALACIRLSDETMLHILNDFNIPQEELGYLKNELAQIERSIDFTLDFEGEKYLAFDEIQRSIVTTPLGNHLYLKRVNSSPYKSMYGEFNSGSDSLKMLFTFPDKEQSFSNIDSFYDKMKEYSEIPPHKIDDLVSVMEKESNDQFLLKTVIEPFAECILQGYKAKIDFDASVLILDLEMYKEANGVYPESLKTLLCDGYIRQIPMDPFSGKELVYLKQGDSFLLYSVGVDKADNQGKRLCTKDRPECGSIWDDTGYDVVYWPVGQ